MEFSNFFESDLFIKTENGLSQVKKRRRDNFIPDKYLFDNLVEIKFWSKKDTASLVSRSINAIKEFSKNQKREGRINARGFADKYVMKEYIILL